MSMEQGTHQANYPGVGALGPWVAVILAAGKGTRMGGGDRTSKVLYRVGGVPMIHSCIQACWDAGVSEIRVILGHNASLVEASLKSWAESKTGMGGGVLGKTSCQILTFHQREQLGTADAVRRAQVEDFPSGAQVLILNGDHPLIEAKDIRRFMGEVKRRGESPFCLVTSRLSQPGSLGRVVRGGACSGGGAVGDQEIDRIVEVSEASPDILRIQEVNSGIYLVPSRVLKEYLPRIKNDNKKGEFYLTDLVSLFREGGGRVDPILASPRVAFGVNTQMELARANAYVFRKKNRELMEGGVQLVDPSTTHIERAVRVGSGTIIYPHVYLGGGTEIGEAVLIESHCHVVDSRIENGVVLKAYSYLENSVICDQAVVGPFSRLRPETEIGSGARVGNFVEMKKVKFGAGAKAGHLTYLGDAEVGEGTNVGCGTITCNYAVDKKKYKTFIGKNVFVGSDSQFVAPVHVGDGAVIASGSTITEDVPEGSLAIARSRQVNKRDYRDCAGVKKARTGMGNRKSGK